MPKKAKPLEEPTRRTLRIADEEVVGPGLEVPRIVFVQSLENAGDSRTLRVTEDHDLLVIECGTC